MSTPDSTGKVLTVLGPVDPLNLGITLTHEHLLIDLSAAFVPPVNDEGRRLANEPLSIENLGWVRVNWASSNDNLVYQDVETGKREVAHFKNAGGQSLVDATTIGIDRNPEALAEISRASGVNIIMGAGYYVGPSHPEDFSSRSVDSITDEIIRDVQVGVGGTGIRCGIIGEIGCSWPWTDDEKKSVAAAVAAQRATGAPLLIHPGRDQKAPIEIVNFIDREGGDLSSTIMSHVDIRIYEREILRELAATGIYIEFDTFGLDSPFQPHALELFMPSDSQRIEKVKWLVEDGDLERILLAHDICTKHRQRTYGGHGLDYVPANVTGWMRLQGITQRQIDTMLIENPKRVLTFV
jgi:phosphotriesterase-related protein